MDLMRHNIYYNEESDLGEGEGEVHCGTTYYRKNNLAHDGFTVVLYITMKMYSRLDDCDTTHCNKQFSAA